jgi:hypothetical protein
MVGRMIEVEILILSDLVVHHWLSGMVAQKTAMRNLILVNPALGVEAPETAA